MLSLLPHRPGGRFVRLVFLADQFIQADAQRFGPGLERFDTRVRDAARFALHHDADTQPRLDGQSLLTAWRSLP
jgi:hypothetical protein